MKTILSEDRVERLSGKVGVKRDVWDATVRGLHVRVTKSSSGLVTKTWRLDYTYAGKRTIWSLGPWPKLSVEEAQEKARQAHQMIRDGFDPRAEAERERRERERAAERAGELTFDALAKDYIQRQRDRGIESVNEIERQLEKDVLPSIGSVPAAEVTFEDVDRILAPIVKRGSKIMANRVRALLYSVFRWGLRDRVWQHVLDRNPVEATERPMTTERPRDRVLEDDEVKRLWIAAEPPEDGKVILKSGKLDPIVSAAFRLRLLTGQRWTEIATARWEDIRQETVEVNGRTEKVWTWTIPREKTKTRRNAHVVPLSSQALAVLDTLRPITESTGSIFPGRRRGREREGGEQVTHLGRVNRSFRAWSKAAGVEDFIGKDIRRTVITGLSRLGVDLEVRQAVANHRPAGVTKQVYDRYDQLAEKLVALQKWGRHVERLVTGELAKVVAIGGRS